MPHLFNLVARHEDGREIMVSECPLSWKQAQQEWLTYTDLHMVWFDTLEHSLKVEQAALQWCWIDTALSLTPVENFFMSMCE